MKLANCIVCYNNIILNENTNIFNSFIYFYYFYGTWQHHLDAFIDFGPVDVDMPKESRSCKKYKIFDMCVF